MRENATVTMCADDIIRRLLEIKGRVMSAVSLKCFHNLASHSIIYLYFSCTNIIREYLYNYNTHNKNLIK